jgi:hypothetical protein
MIAKPYFVMEHAMHKLQKTVVNSTCFYKLVLLKEKSLFFGARQSRAIILNFEYNIPSVSYMAARELQP